MSGGRKAFLLAIVVWALLIVCCFVRAWHESAGAVDLDDGRLPGDDIPATERCYMTEEEIREDWENLKIQDALIAKAHKIPGCTVTWYTADTCGKSPSDPAYGITASGLRVQDHLTVAVDRKVIPLYADVFVQLPDGTIEQLWATDTGVRGNHIDIYTSDYDYAIQMGCMKLDVYWVV